MSQGLNETQTTPIVEHADDAAAVRGLVCLTIVLVLMQAFTAIKLVEARQSLHNRAAGPDYMAIQSAYYAGIADATNEDNDTEYTNTQDNQEVLK